jgi:hypothetical protein
MANTNRIITIASPYAPIRSPDRNEDEDSDESEISMGNPHKADELRFKDQKISMLRLLVKNSKVEDITDFNELQDSLHHHWREILDSHEIDIDQSEWETMKKFFQGETVMDNSNIMEFRLTGSCKAMFDSLYEDMDYEFYQMFRKDCILPNIPKIIKDLDLQDAYEQLVFYEYIYSSSMYSLYHKLRWMVEHDYSVLVSLLNNHHLSVWDRRARTETVGEYVVLAAEFLNQKADTRYNLFNTLLNLHSNMFEFDINDVLHHPAFNYDPLEDTLSTRPNYAHRIEDYLMLSTLYEQAGDQRAFVNLLNDRIRMLGRRAIRLSEQDTQLETYAKFSIVNLLMRMVEDGNLSWINLSAQQEADIIYAWLTNSSRVLANSNLRYVRFNGCVSPYILQCYTRELNIENIRESLRYVNMDFASMTYIYLKDNLEMFEIITRNCSFDEVNSSVITYYPASIINHIVVKKNISLLDFARSCIRYSVPVRLTEMCAIELSRVERYVDTILRYANKKIEFKPILKHKCSGDNEDIIVLHELRELNEFTELRNVVSHIYLDNIVVGTDERCDIFTKFTNHVIPGMLTYIFFGGIFNLMEKYATYVITHPDFCRWGPDLPEMWVNLSFMKAHIHYRASVSHLVAQLNEVSDDEKINLRDYVATTSKYGTYQSDSDSDYDSNDEYIGNSDDCDTEEWGENAYYEFSDSDMSDEYNEFLYGE